MQKRKASACGLLVVVELGGEWPAWLHEHAQAQGRRVVTQEEGETPSVFAERIADQLETLTMMGVPLSVAALACNERTDATALAARRQIARLFLGVMAKKKRGCMHLTAAQRSSVRLRQALTTLATDLNVEWKRSGLRTDVRFADEMPALQTTAALNKVQRVA
jgi:hypothetical protein